MTRGVETESALDDGGEEGVDADEGKMIRGEGEREQGKGICDGVRGGSAAGRMR
jgi:hypothetical protein